MKDTLVPPALRPAISPFFLSSLSLPAASSHLPLYASPTFIIHSRIYILFPVLHTISFFPYRGPHRRLTCTRRAINAITMLPCTGA